MAGATMTKKFSWAVFILLLLAALLFLTRSVATLPPMVASHFDAAGYPNAFMTRSGYSRFIVAMGIGLPIAMVALLTSVYSRASNMKLPNRDYWLAPERIAQTRAILVVHGVWFGSLLICMVCFVHWLVMGAHQRVPPQLSNSMFLGGLLVFFLITASWIVAMLLAFRLPRVASIRVEPPLE
jgi:hypothetical protein